MKVFHFNFHPNHEIRGVFSIDPGFKTSGFASVNFVTKKVETWGAPANDVPIMGVPFPDLYRIARERSIFLLSQFPKNIELDHTELIVEYTVLHKQFSVSLNVLITTLLDMLIEQNSVAKITLVPPRTTQWFIKLRSVKPSEIKRFVSSKFPIEWARKGRWNSHAADALLITAYCHYEFFRDLGIDLREPKVEFVERNM